MILLAIRAASFGSMQIGSSRGDEFVSTDAGDHIPGHALVRRKPGFGNHRQQADRRGPWPKSFIDLL